MKLRCYVYFLVVLSLASLLMFTFLLSTSSRADQQQLQKRLISHAHSLPPTFTKRMKDSKDGNLTSIDVFAVLRNLRMALLNESSWKYFTVLSDGANLDSKLSHLETKEVYPIEKVNRVKHLLEITTTPPPPQVTLDKVPPISNTSKPLKKSKKFLKDHLKPAREGMELTKRCYSGNFCPRWSDPDDIWRHNYCLANAISLEKHGLEIKPCQCRLLEASHTERTALSSLPGSGNTWVRELLEAATGVCTASMWCDPVLRGLKFCAEGVQGTATLVVKNHDPVLRWRGDNSAKQLRKPEFDSAIFIHRDPYDATVAEWNRALAFKIANASRYNVTLRDVPEIVAREVTLNSHITHFGKEFFGDHPEWNEMVHVQLDKWERMVDHLIVENSHHPVLVVDYNHLKMDYLMEVKRMLEFLEFPFNAGELQAKLSSGFDSFRRNQSVETFEHFTSAQKAFVNSAILRIIGKLKFSKFSSKFDIPLIEYIRS